MIGYNLQFFGGRGASSGGKYTLHKKEMRYGEEYQTVLQVGNIKFIKLKDETRAVVAPLETVSKNRIYVTLDRSDEPKYITFMGKNKRVATIDLSGNPHNIGGEMVPPPHIHFGEKHNEYGDAKINENDQKFIAYIKNIIYNYRKKQ